MRFALIFSLTIASLAGCATMDTAKATIVQQVKNMDDRVHGKYYDKDTGLMWYVCPIGQNFNIDRQFQGGLAYQCMGNPVLLDNNDVNLYVEHFVNGQKLYGYSDWRLPTVFELEQLGISNCELYHQLTTGSGILTADGRKMVYQNAVRKSLNNDGAEIIIDDCKVYSSQNLIKYFNSIYLSQEQDIHQVWAMAKSSDAKYYVPMSAHGLAFGPIGFKLDNFNLGTANRQLPFYIVRKTTN